MPKRSIYVGFDAREVAAFCVAVSSIRRHLSEDIPIRGLVLEDLKQRGLYWRPMNWKPSELERPVMWDVISDAPMSTEFAVSRFIVPHLAGSGWALFMDCDMTVLTDLNWLFNYVEFHSDKAVFCVKHKHMPTYTTKMDGQVQTTYGRKNWSSVMLFNCDHPSNKKLTLEMVNTLRGRELHGFCWLEDDEIGELGPEWNFLVGHTDPSIDPKIIHHTDGSPCLRGYENAPWADLWREELARFGSLTVF